MYIRHEETAVKKWSLCVYRFGITVINFSVQFGCVAKVCLDNKLFRIVRNSRYPAVTHGQPFQYNFRRSMPKSRFAAGHSWVLHRYCQLTLNQDFRRLFQG